MAGSEDIWEIDWDAYEEEVEAGPEYEYVLGLDPGGTTGVAMLRYTADTKPELIYLHQIPDGHEGFWDFFRGTVPAANIHIASEKWVEFSGKKGTDHEPLIVEGVEYTIWEDEITWQEPAMKQLIGDDYLKENNLWTPNHRHQMDALIHALVYLRNEVQHTPTLKSLSGDDGEPMAQPGQAENAQLEQDGEEGEGGESIEEMVARAMSGLSKAEQALKDAIDANGEAAEAAGEAMKAFGDVVNSDEEGTVSGSNDRSQAGEYIDDEKEPEGTRARREKNGVFMGYAPEEDEVVKELYVD